MRLSTLQLLAVAAATALSPSLASAQAYLNAGVTAGINLANVSVDPAFSTFTPGATQGMRVGPIVGGTLEWGVRGFPIAFQPEVQYVEKGVIVQGKGPGEASSSENYKLTYIEFPVLARIQLMEQSVRGYLVVGPNFGFNLAATSAITPSGSVRGFDYFSGFKRSDIAIDIGGGAEFELSPGMRALVDLRYSHGLTDVTLAAEGRPADETWYSRDIKLKVGLKWDVWTAQH